VRDEGALAQPDGEKLVRVEAQTAEDIAQLEHDALASLEELLEMLSDAVRGAIDEDFCGALKRGANQV
jgi:hypothetical protein